MKQLLLFLNSTKLYFYLLVCCSMGIALQLVIYKIAVILLLFIWLTGLDFKNKLRTLYTNTYAVALIVFYMIYAISILWTENISFALTDLLLKSPIFILPLIIATREKISKRKLNIILFVFACSILFLNFGNLINAYFNYLDSHKISDFYYEKLTVNMNSAYQAMFSCFSIVVFIYLFVREEVINKLVAYFVVAFQLIFILLIASRMQIIIIALLTPVFILSYYYKKKKLSLGLLYVILIFITVKFIVETPSSLNVRYKQTVFHIKNIGAENSRSDARKYIWEEAFGLIKDNWVLGLGIGDAKDDLLACYVKSSEASRIKQINNNSKTVKVLTKESIKNKISYEKQVLRYANRTIKTRKNRYEDFILEKYNYHCQYLQTFATIGFAGFSLLLLLLVIPFVKALMKNEYLVASFFLIIAASFLTESILERQAGVIFVAFFYPLLVCGFNQNKPS